MALQQGELHALRNAAEQAWDDDTRHPAYHGHPLRSAGQCYVTSRWLADRLGGHVGRKDGHHFYVSPDQSHAVDLTGDLLHHAPVNPRVAGMRFDEDDPGIELGAHHATWRPGPIVHKSVAHPLFQGHEIVAPVADERASRFAARANRIFDNPQLLARTADMAGDAYPGETPQAVNDMQQRYMHDEPGLEPGFGEYNFVYANGHLEVSPDHDHEQLASHSGIGPDHTGPVAVGHIFVTQGQARFEVTGNIAASALVRVFKDYAKHVGWVWGGLTDTEGWPVSDEYAPKKSKRMYFGWDGADLTVSTRLVRVASSNSRILGHLDMDEAEQTLRVVPTRLPTYFASMPAIRARETRQLGEAILDFAADQGFTLLGRGENAVRTVEDLDQGDLYDPNPTQPDDHQYPAAPPDERQPGGVFRCPTCDVIFPTWSSYQYHRQSEEPMGDLPDREPDQNSGFPDEPALGVQEQNPYVQMSSVQEARRVPGFTGHRDGDKYAVAYRHGCVLGYARLRDDHLSEIRTVRSSCELPLLEKIVKVTARAPKDLIEGPLPFIYDIQDDTIDVGQANTRTSDIPGRFTPGGIIEGMYEPGGKVIIRTQTNMPYVLRHMLELWYTKNPMLEVKSVHLQDDGGGNTKLASSVGGYVAAMVAADPVAAQATRALQAHGGMVYAVGGAVRDAVIGKEPKDIDLLVRGLAADEVHRILGDLGGRVDLTGKDFGVYRYREGDSEVEVALPRSEGSTGDGHVDFEVTVDPSMDVEDDLYRRDFTANAMAVNLATGALIDPYHGASAVENGLLSSVSQNSLAEDPLRIVRALVAYARHGLYPDPKTRIQMATHAASLRHLPAERIQAELDKLFAAAKPAHAIRLAHKTGVLAYILPEVDDAFGFDQRNPHHELELGEHLLSVLDRVSQISDDADVRLAALLHDIGKPASAWQDPDPTKGMHYYRNEELGLGQSHELVGADLARDRMSALKYPNDRIERVSRLVRHHMFANFETERGARKFLARVGEHADDLLALRYGDQGSKKRAKTASTEVNQLAALVATVREKKQVVDLSHLAINGHNLVEAGIAPGPRLGATLRYLLDQVLEDPALNHRETLVQLAHGYHRTA